MNQAMEPITVSVVIAHHGEGPALQECLRTHREGMEPQDELIVLAGGPGDLTPMLWRQGIQRATGTLVRITIGSFVPAPGWRQALVTAHQEADVVGGPMDMASGLRWRDRAQFFQRYRAFRPPLAFREVGDVPADHSSYRAEVLEETRDLWREGFWERDVNAALARRGRRLVLDPAFPATYRGGESAGRFLAHRFRHGIQFGRQRLVGRGAAVRLAYVLVFLLPGLVFLARILRESLAVPKSGWRLLTASGWLLLFVLAWSLGEWVGAVRGPASPAVSS